MKSANPTRLKATTNSQNKGRVRIGLPEMAGQLGAAYAIPILYVPLLMITHIAAFRLLLRSDRRAEVR